MSVSKGANLPVFRPESPLATQIIDQRHHSHPNLSHQLSIEGSCHPQSHSRAISIPLALPQPQHLSRLPSEITPNTIATVAPSPAAMPPPPYPASQWYGSTYVDFSLYTRQEPMPRQVKEWMCCQCGHVVQPVSRHDCGRCLHEFCPYCPRRRYGDPPDRRPSQDLYY